MNTPARTACACARALKPKLSQRSFSLSSSSYAPSPAAEVRPEASTSAAGASALTHFRVTLIRSPLGLPKPFHDACLALGLRKRMAVRYHPHTPHNAGLILQLKELLKVENVTTEEADIGRKAKRTLEGDNRGYRVIGNIIEDRVRAREEAARTEELASSAHGATPVP